MGFGTPQESTSSLSTPDRTASFFGQASYNYNHKFLLSVTMRADGSTKFAPGNQWGYFPSVSGAWVLSEEKFMEDIKWIDQLKLRAAIGLAGNNRISDDMWRYLYTVNSTGGPGFGEATQFGEQWYGNQGGTTFANKNIKWNKNGDVTFGKNVTMTWDNLDQSVKDELVSKSIRIVGTDTFTLLGDLTGADPVTNPADITLTLEEENLQSTSSQRQWYYLQGYDYIPFEGENGKTLTIWPFEPYWDNGNSLTVRCIVKFSDEEYSATFTIRKQYIVGYSLEITSSQGVSYKNNSCQTVLTANVYYQGKLVDPDYVAKNYIFKWTRYHLPDMENEVIDWWKEQRDNEGNIVQQEIDRSKPSITLNYGISGQDCFMCELLNGNMFPYEFPLIF